MRGLGKAPEASYVTKHDDAHHQPLLHYRLT